MEALNRQGRSREAHLKFNRTNKKGDSKVRFQPAAKPLPKRARFFCGRIKWMMNFIREWHSGAAFKSCILERDSEF